MLHWNVNVQKMTILYTVESISDGKIINSAHVCFDESSFPGLEREGSSFSDEGAGYEIQSAKITLLYQINQVSNRITTFVNSMK